MYPRGGVANGDQWTEDMDFHTQLSSFHHVVSLAMQMLLIQWIEVVWIMVDIDSGCVQEADTPSL